MKIGLLLTGLLVLIPAWSQTPDAVAQPIVGAAAPRHDAVHRVDPAHMYHRVYARVPLLGSGKKGDPLRPMFAPLASEMKGDHTGVLAYQMHICDDGKTALVEFLGATPSDLQHIIASKDKDVIVYERGKVSPDEIETEFKKYKKDFTMKLFNTRAQ